MQSSLITVFISKHPLLLAISQWTELGWWYWAQCVHFLKSFQNPTCFAQLGATSDSFWLTYAILSNFRFSYQTPPTPPFSNGHHFSMDRARMLRLGSMSSFFQALSESHLFCSIWCNRRLVLTLTTEKCEKIKKITLVFFNIFILEIGPRGPNLDL